MFGIPGKVVVRVLKIGLAKGSDRVACEQRFVLDSSLLLLTFDLHMRISYLGHCDSPFPHTPKLLPSSRGI